MNELYSVPAKLKPAYFSYIWGGTLLRERLGKDIPTDDIGESWEVSAHPKGQSVLISGPAEGRKLGDYIEGAGFYGCMPTDKFPLLIKFLGAKDNLSVQVHPSDANCRPGEAGKAEAWYIVDCEPGAELIYDINCTKEEFARAVKESRIADGLRRLAVKPGDVLDIPAGMVHALTAGIIVYEVQQNSDTTYRLYDWGRVEASTGKPRELHIAPALNVIVPGGSKPVDGKAYAEPGGVRTALINNARFTLEKIDVNGSFTDTWFNSFAAFSVIRGSGSVVKDGAKLFDVTLGDSFISPAEAGAVEMSGNMTVLKSHVPPQEKYAAWLNGKG